MRARSFALVVALGVASATAACTSNDGASATAESDPQACASCHLDTFRAVTHPVHEGKKPTTCGVCHTQQDWHPSRIDHAWPLTGAHAKEDACFECHKGEPTVFHGTPKACFGCHAADYQKAPHHVADHYPQTCEECHSTTAFKPLLPTATRTEHAPPSTTAAATASETPAAKTTLPKIKPAKTATTATATATTPPPDATSAASQRYRR